MRGKTWTREEKDYLCEKWGTVSLGTLTQKLGRSEAAIMCMKTKLGLGAFLDNGDYVTWNQFLKAIGITGGGGYLLISWIANRGFPIHHRRVNENSFKVVYLEEWWEWAEKNKDFLDFSKFEENTLGVEPSWAKKKRKIDYERNRKYIKSPWTKAEDDKLVYLLKKHKYSYDDLSKRLCRTNGAIQRRILDLGLMERPVKADNMIKWTDQECQRLGELIADGYGYEFISEDIGKSSKAIRGKVYTMYLSENLDKVRSIIGTGGWGDNRPDRKVKQHNVMNTEERRETKELLTRFAAICRHVYKQNFDDCDYWQKELCRHWEGYCTKNETDCDSCLSVERILPQYCKQCGGTFYERSENLYCSKCREQRRRQYLKKKAILQSRKAG